MSDAANNLSATNAAVSGKTAGSLANKRAVRRCPLVASTEVTERDSQTKISARVSEIGLGGCYVDTLSPFPNGTHLSAKPK
jgi:hypothetical protein